MIDIANKRCQDPKGCETCPSYGLEGEHKLPDMISIGHKSCQDPDGCGKRLSHGFEGDKKSTYCKKHKLQGMIN